MEHSVLLGEAKISKLLIKFSIPCIMGLLISAVIIYFRKPKRFVLTK